MKKLLLLTVMNLFFAFAATAQYVNIPDTTFRNDLRYKYPSCFNAAGQMDTTCSAIVNEDSLTFFSASFSNMQGLRFFKNLLYLQCGSYSYIQRIPELPATLLYLSCRNSSLTELSTLPSDLQYLDVSSNPLTSLPVLPNSLLYLNCNNSPVGNFPSLPANLRSLNCLNCAGLTTFPALPAFLKYLDVTGDLDFISMPALPLQLDTLRCPQCRLTSLPSLPGSLKFLDCNQNLLNALPPLPAGLIYLDATGNTISSMPALPASLKVLLNAGNPVRTMPTLPPGLTLLNCSQNGLTSLPPIPATLIKLDCYRNAISALPSLPDNMVSLRCGYNPLHVINSFPDSLTELECAADLLSELPTLPDHLITLSCDENQLASLPPLPATLENLNCTSNLLTSLPALPPHLNYLDCHYNLLTELPPLPKTLTYIFCIKNNIYCLPVLPDSTNLAIEMDAYKVSCLPNHPQTNFGIYGYDESGHQIDLTSVLPLCNPTNNTHHCESFPVMAGIIFYDNNSNGIRDINEPLRKYGRVTLSNDHYSFTNRNGYYEIGANNTGSYILSAEPPRYFNAMPSTYSYNFINNDTLVTNNFALQANTVIDSVAINIYDGWRARPGFPFTYELKYENAGTTILSPSIVFNYDNTRLTYDSSSNAAVVNNGTYLSLPVGSFVPGQEGNFIAYFTVKSTATIGDTLSANVSINANGSGYRDTILTGIRGSFDPNEKEATSQLSPSQVAAGNYIEYTIRFQNTGTDTAFNIVVSDVLSNNLQAATLQMLNSSHNCKATVKDNSVFFEFLNILLPDSNVNEPKSHGFVSFRIKPKSTVAVNSIIPNKAAIYFDYNAPVITNTATTEIKIPLVPVPLKLQFFTVIKQTENTAMVSWNTANEINIAGFYIEQSFDGSSFTNIASENAKGRQYNTYSRSISIPATAVVYYRLRIIDIDGQFTYSPVVALRKNKMAEPFTVLYNPVKDILNIAVQDDGLRNTIAKVINGQGAVLQTAWLLNNIEAIDVSKLPAGMYILQTEKGSRQFILVK